MRVHRTISGEGPPLILASSLGTTSAIWQPQLAALEEIFQVVRYDHRGHGGSPVPQGPYAIEDLGNDLLTLLDDLELDRAHIAGLSLGGMAAMWVASHAPHRVERLALICTSARMEPQGWADRANLVRAGGMPAIADAVLSRWFTPSFTQQHPAVAGWARGMLTATPAEGYVACCAAIETMDLEPAIGAIIAPTIVIAGGKDQATPVEHAQRIAVAVPACRLEVVPEAAHLANVEQPEIVTTLLRGFLDDRR